MNHIHFWVPTCSLTTSDRSFLSVALNCTVTLTSLLAASSPDEGLMLNSEGRVSAPASCHLNGSAQVLRMVKVLVSLLPSRRRSNWMPSVRILFGRSGELSCAC
jgi:hypothetical protein